jgi:2-polyprenyl-6-methoxyphenol hydroxylase-like FAD-dependent oxidoreductase
MESTARDVAVVGGGPVGLALALFLDHNGVRCTVYNDGRVPTTQPRGNTHNARTMEHYRRLGIAHRVRALGLPADHPTDVAYFTRYNGHELARLPMPSTAGKLDHVATAEETDQTPEPLHRANQVYVERLLFEHAASKPGIRLRFGWRVTDVRQSDTEVTLHAEQTDTGAPGQWQAAYAVGCDGGQSVVRAAIGGTYGGSGTLDQDVLGRRASATHLRIPSLYRDFVGDRRAWSYWAMGEGLAVNLITLNGADEFFLLTSSVDPDDPDPRHVTDLVHRAAGSAVPVEVLGHRAWTPGLALVADRFADRRLLLAGDAAHLFTPTGGFGMNTGIDDVANLAWKLAARLLGWGGRELLPSYQAERQPVARRNTAAARRLNANLGAIRPDAALDEDSAAGRAERAEIGGVLSGYGEQFASVGVQLGARYDGSPIVCPDGEPPADDVATYRPSSVPGGRAPHVWCGPGRGSGDSLYDRLGDGFTLLRLGSRPPDVTGVVAAARTGGVPLTVLDVPAPAARDLYQRDLALVRPDHHVAWRGNQPPSDPTALLDLVTGH